LVDRLPPSDASADIERFNAWVKAHLEKREAQLTVASIAAVIQAQELFPEVDPFEDPLGEPAEPPSRWY